jgi:uncharacterized protein with FMN-binding domain
MIKVVMALVSTAVGLTLLLSFKSHSAGAPRSALADASPRSTSGSDGAPTPSSGAKATKRPKASAHPAGRSGTFTGDPIDTRYGTMQVAAVILNGKLTNVRVLQETDGGRSHQIDDAAIPILTTEALSAKSANIDVVSGATSTSEGYAQSLQSALDKAGI